MNEQSIEQLLHDAPEPPMHIDLDQILAKGRSRQRRRRMTALGSIAAALVLAVAVGFGAQSWDTTTPVPAHHTTTTTSDFFAPDSGLAANQAYQRAFGKQSMWTTKQVLTVVRVDGALSLRHKGSTHALPVRSSIDGALGRASIVTNGKGSILLTPVPADATSVQIDSTTVGSSSTQGVTLPDGSHVALVFTDKPISPSAVDGWFWSTSAGGYEYSTGQRASVASLGSTHAFYFPTQKILGIGTADGIPVDWGRAGVGEFMSRGESTGKGHMTWSYITLLPRTAYGIRAELPSSYHSRWTPVLRHANLPGTSLQVFGMSLSSHNDHPSGHPVIHWIDRHGDQHTVR